MKLISEITSIVLVLYVFACLVDGFQLRRDRQILRGGVCVGFIAFLSGLMSLAGGVIFSTQFAPQFSDVYNWIAWGIPLLGLLASFFVTSEKMIALLVTSSAGLTLLNLAVFTPISLLRLQANSVSVYIVPAIILMVLVACALISQTPFIRSILRFLSTFICVNYIISKVLGYLITKLVGVPRPPDFATPFAAVAGSYAAAIAAWFVALAIVRRFQRQTSSVTSEA